MAIPLTIYSSQAMVHLLSGGRLGSPFDAARAAGRGTIPILVAFIACWTFTRIYAPTPAATASPQPGGSARSSQLRQIQIPEFVPLGNLDHGGGRFGGHAGNRHTKTYALNMAVRPMPPGHAFR